MSKTYCLRVCSVLETIRSKPTDMILSHTNQATWTLWTCVIHNLCIFTALYSKMMSGSNGFTQYCIDTNDCISYDIHLQVICAIFMLIPSSSVHHCIQLPLLVKPPSENLVQSGMVYSPQLVYAGATMFNQQQKEGT